MKKVIIAATAIVAGFIMFSATYQTGHGNPNGAPSGAAGAPNDGGMPAGTCAKSGCHNGTPIAQDGMITSDIPVTGYVPGQTYTITATITAQNKVRFGFQISPQSSTGTKLGTIVVTNTTQTQTVGAGKYITHKQAGTSGTGTRTWTFNWTAPAAGTGNVTFYGSLMAANNNGGDSGDQVYNSTLTVTESTGNGTEDIGAKKFIASIYPNPTNGNFTVAVYNAKTPIVTKVFTADGRLVYSNVYQNTGNGTQILPIATAGLLTVGLYFVSIETDGIQKVEKLVVQ